VQIEGLQQGSHAPKKPVYGNRKKKAPISVAASSSGPATREPSPTSSPGPTVASELPAASDASPTADVKDDWDASSEEEAQALPDGVKESWDDDSEKEEEKPTGMTSLSTLSVISHVAL
jgi:translation initiation factor 5B